MPTIQIPEKLLPVVSSKKRFVVLIGGRGSGKSESVARLLLMKCQTESADILCGREFQNSIDESVHKLFKDLINNQGFPGFTVTDTKINCTTGGKFRFRGFSRNSDGVKSYQGFKYGWVEEAQSLSEQSIKDLTPTIRAEGSQLYFTGNPRSSGDPFSQRFIVPYLADLQSKGYYEDDMHLIIMVNWRDNPWFPKELRQERDWDFANLPRAKYDHIWEGAFDDTVEDSLILAEWFDACIDSHKKLGFNPVGLKMAAHDPSDEGNDSKGFAYRHGSVVLDVQEKTTGNVNEGGDWAADLALKHGVDAFTWDCDGMGVALSRQMQQSFDGKHTKITMFKGSEGVDNPEALFEAGEGQPLADRKTNKQALKNKRAQYYLELRKRVYNTYRAVEHGAYIDPDKMISFDSSIECLQKLRSELCRMPVKPNGNGLFELYPKPEMKRKFGFPSPNLADSVMMLMRQPHIVTTQQVHLPKAMPVIRGRR